MDGRATCRGYLTFSVLAAAGVAALAMPLAGCVGTDHFGTQSGSGGAGNASTTTAGTGNSSTSGTGGTGGITIVDPPPPPPGGTDGGSMPAGRGGAAGTMTTACSGGTGGAISMTPGRGVLFPPSTGVTVTLATAPPAVSGGTLRVLADGQTAVAADPDRDLIYVVDLSARSVTGTVRLVAGDEPGRVVEDAAGRVHVALRHGGAIVTFDPRAQQLDPMRRQVCASPRGLAYDANTDLVHVACADGELVSLPAASGGPTRLLQLDRDLRDVVVDGARLRVSRFRTAELLTVEADGTVSQRMTPPDFSTPLARAGQRFTAGAAWRMIQTADGGVAMLHQRGVADAIHPVTGGYGGLNPCDAIVHPTVTTVASDGTVRSGPVMAGMVLAVDMAISPDGSRVALVSLGNATNQLSSSTGPQLRRVFVTSLTTATDSTIGCKPDGTSGPCLPPMTTILSMGTSGTTMTGCPADPQVVGQPIAVAFAGDGSVVVQSREPAMLALADGTSITLTTDSRGDTGHLLFHANSGGFMACATCHLEGDDDGRIWTFDCGANGVAAGARRTQSLQTGIANTQPYHWNGDEADFTQLMTDVFAGRMSGPKLPTDQMNAMMTWIDAQPRPLRPAPANPDAVARGAALFNDQQNVGCVTCHSGSRFSNNLTVDVGTGRAFQVPSLLGISTRGPFMHDGCATTLRDRFDPTCGGAQHGSTAGLSSGQIDDLIAFLGSL